MTTNPTTPELALSASGSRIARTVSQKPMRELLELLRQSAPDHRCDFSELTIKQSQAQLTANATTVMGICNQGMAAIGHLLAHSAPVIEDGTVGADSCAATMVTTFPEGAMKLLASTMLPDAFKKEYPGLNMKVNGLALSTDIEYSSQMTDDKKNLLVEVKGLQGVVEIASVAGRTGLFLVKAAPTTAAVAAAAETPSTTAPQATQSAQTATDGTGATELNRYAGKSTASLMADAGMSAKLKQLLGKDYAAFKERMEVSGDVGQDAGYLWAIGNMPHEGISEVAGFAVNSKTGEVVAVVLVGGKQYKFYGVNKPAELPQPLLEWYKQRNESQ
jgi:hypothetical protein